MLATEAALQQQLVVPGQLLSPSERPAGVERPSVPQVVIPPTGRSYAQVATSSPLDGTDRVYVARGGAAKLMSEKYSSHYKVLERGNKACKIQVGEKVEIISRDRLKPHLGSVAPKAAVPPKRGRPRTASVASASVAVKPGGPCNGAWVKIPGQVCLVIRQCNVQKMRQ